MRIIKNPIICEYFATYRCNSRCVYCNIWKKANNCQDANLSNAKKNIDDAKKLGVHLIDFTGGEPLLNKNLPEMIRYAKSVGMRTKLSTNAYLYPKHAHKLHGIVDDLSFSLDTIDRDEYKKIRGIDGFDNVLESIDIAKSLDENVRVIYTVTNDNIKNLDDMISFCQKKKVYLSINPVFSYFDNDSLDLEHINVIKSKFFDKYVYVNLAQLRMIKKGGNHISNPICNGASFAISPDNFLLLPCYHRQLEKIPIDDNLYSLYKSGDVQNIINKSGKYSFCENCTNSCYICPNFVTNVSLYTIQTVISVLKYENIIKSLTNTFRRPSP